MERVRSASKKEGMLRKQFKEAREAAGSLPAGKPGDVHATRDLNPCSFLRTGRVMEVDESQDKLCSPDHEPTNVQSLDTFPSEQRMEILTLEHTRAVCPR